MSSDSFFSAAINLYIQSELLYACDDAKKVESRDFFRQVEIQLKKPCNRIQILRCDYDHVAIC